MFDYRMVTFKHADLTKITVPMLQNVELTKSDSIPGIFLRVLARVPR